jgi:hypothetical protein
MTCNLKTSKHNKSCGQSSTTQCSNIGTLNQTSKDSWRTMPKQTRMLSELFIVLGMPLLGWLKNNVHLCSIRLQLLDKYTK